MFLLSGPQREGERAQAKGGWNEVAFFPSLNSASANEMMGQSSPTIPPRSFLPPQLFSEGALFCCHVIIARKENSGGRGGA